MKRFLSAILTVFLILSVSPVAVGAEGGTVKNRIDLPYIGENTFGNGYEWDNLNYVLKLNNLKLETSDQFGIKLPAGSTVELSGESYVKATSYAIYCLGGVTFTGKGSLTLVSGEHGIGYAKKDYLHELYGDKPISIMRGIKKVFDEKNILNPGKII